MDLSATYRIVSIAKEDAWFKERKVLIGVDGRISKVHRKEGNWIGCTFIFEERISIYNISLRRTIFYKVLLKKLNQQPTIVDKTYVSV